MFTSISIKNFRSCSDVHIEDIPSMMVLMGRNGAGKTNVLKAIEWACATASAAAFSLRNAPGIPRQISLSFDIDDTKYIYEVEHYRSVSKSKKITEAAFRETLSSLKNGFSQTIFTRDGEKLVLHYSEGNRQQLEISLHGPAMAAINSLRPDGDYHRQITEKIVDRLSAVKYYPLNNFDGLNVDPVIQGSSYKEALENDFAEENDALQTVYKIIRLHNEFPEKFEELRALLGGTGIGLLDDIAFSKHEVRSDNRKSTSEITDHSFLFLNFIPFANTEDSQEFSFDDLSFGTKRIISLFTSMLYDGSSVSLIEQPEDGIHPGLLDKVTSMLKTYSNHAQFMLTTHSPTVLNRLTPEEVYLVSMDDGATQVRHLTEQEISAAENYMKNDGPLAEFLESIEED